jgi:predicted ATP-grasp superfamily ATP-dependent carboligase
MSNLYFVGKAARIALPMMQAASAYGKNRCSLIGDAETVPLLGSAHCAAHFLVHFERPDDEHFCALVNKLADASSDAVLVPFDCDGSRMVGRLRARLRMRCAPLPSLPTLDMLDDKWTFHAFCTRNGFSVPASRRFASKYTTGFAPLVAEFGLPFVLKPTNGSGSVGVQIVRSEAQFEREILRNPDYDHAPLIAQKFIDGEDIDLSLQAENGRLNALAIQQIQGRRIRFVANAYLEGFAAELCRASAYHGVMHIDARIERKTGQVYLIECNPRFWASLTAAACCGLNFVSESLYPRGSSRTVQRLTSGACNMRHPLLQPSAWWTMLVDRRAAGRLLRSRFFDAYTLRELLGDIASRALAGPNRVVRPLFSPRRVKHPAIVSITRQSTEGPVTGFGVPTHY